MFVFCTFHIFTIIRCAFSLQVYLDKVSIPLLAVNADGYNPILYGTSNYHCLSYLLLHDGESTHFATGSSYKFHRTDDCLKIALELILKPRGSVSFLVVIFMDEAL